MLKFGFGLYDNGNKWGDKAYQALNKVDKDFYNGGLNQLLCIVDVSIITKQTILVIIGRLDTYQKEVLMDLNKFTLKNYKLNLRFYLPRFIGYGVDIYTLSNREYAAKFKTLLDKKIGNFTRKVAQARVSRASILKERQYYNLP